MMDNAAIAQIFENIGKLLEVKGDLPFKIRAYQRVAQELELLPVTVQQLADDGQLRSIPGVGDEIEKKLLEILATGKLAFYENLRAQVPPGILEMMQVPGLGPRMASRLWKELGVTGLEELEAALRDGRVATLPRMGEKTAVNLLSQLEALRGRKGAPVPLGETPS